MAELPGNVIDYSGGAGTIFDRFVEISRRNDYGRRGGPGWMDGFTSQRAGLTITAEEVKRITPGDRVYTLRRFHMVCLTSLEQVWKSVFFPAGNRPRRRNFSTSLEPLSSMSWWLNTETEIQWAHYIPFGLSSRNKLFIHSAIFHNPCYSDVFPFLLSSPPVDTPPKDDVPPKTKQTIIRRRHYPAQKPAYKPNWNKRHDLP